MRFTKFLLSESITKNELSRLEGILDGLYRSLNIDIEFSKHFFERLNDARNKKDITIPELQDIFRKAYGRYAKDFQQYGNGMQAVLKDLQTDINVPFVLKWNKKSKLIELISKTVMRKKGFKTKDKELRV